LPQSGEPIFKGRCPVKALVFAVALVSVLFCGLSAYGWIVPDKAGTDILTGINRP